MSKKDKAAEASTPQFSDVILGLAASAREKMTLREGGIVELDKDFYESTLPEGVTMAQVRKIQDHDSLLVAATGLGLDQIAVSAFKADPNLQNISCDMRWGKTRVDHQLSRNGDFHSGYTVVGLRGSGGGNYKKVQDHLSDLIKRELG